MVRYLSVGLVLIISILALISRKNYSKYKDVKGFLSYVPVFLLRITPKKVRRSIRRIIRKNRVLNKNKLDEETDRELMSIYLILVRGLYIVAAFVFIVSFKTENPDDLYKLKRPEAGASPAVIDMKLRDENSGKIENFNLKINPRELSEEEFKEYSERAKLYIDKNILADNSSADNISSDLVLPEKDETGVLRIIWSSSEPGIINSEGNVMSDEIVDSQEVTLTAEIKDDNYTDNYSRVFIVNKNTNLTSSEKAKVSILNIEENNRSENELVLPHSVEGVKIERSSDKDKTIMSILIIGLAVVFILGYIRYNRLKEESVKRDKELEDAYFGFVNRLAIHIGAGLSLRDAMKHSVQNERCIYLKDEINHMLNKISSGVSESTAYIEFGRAVGSQEYIRLMSLISQNLTYGNSNLIKMLDSETKTGLYVKREHIKKKGEEASEKLILPTSMLLILVIVIVIYPAFIEL